MRKLHEHLVREHKWYADWHQNKSHNIVHHVLFLAVALMVTSALLSAISQNVVAGNNGNQLNLPKVTVKKDLQEMSNKLLSLSYRYQHTKTPEAKAALLAQLIDVANQRKTELLNVMKKHPKDFKQFAFPQTIRKNLPIEISSYIEADITVEGKFSVFHQDDFVNPSNAIWDDMIKTKEGKTFHLNLASDIPLPSIGSTVKVTGTVLDQQIMLASSGTTIETLAAAPPAVGPLGEQKTAVVLWTKTGSTIYTPSQLNNLFFAEPSANPKSVNAYFKEQSFGQTWFTGTVFGPYTVSNCGDPSEINQKVLAATGVDVKTQYSRIAYVSDGANCGTGGVTNGVPNGEVTVKAADTNSLLLMTYHELGHSLGLAHGNSLTCGTKQIDLSSNCYNSEYGDKLTNMGSGGTSQFNAEEKATLSWVPQSKVQYITANGTYTVYASETTQTGPQILSIYKPEFNLYSSNGSLLSKGYLSVDFRQAFGFDLALPSNATKGATIHINRVFDTSNPDYLSWNGYNTRYTYLLDATPGGCCDYDGSVLDGKTFTDDILGVSIKELSHTTNSATVQVAFLPPPPCTRGQTTLDATAITTTGSISTSAGETKAISFTAKNNDTASCGSSNFTFGANVPVGWTVVPSTISIAPFSTGVGTIYMTPPATTAIGTYQVNYKVSDTTLALHNALSGTGNVYVQSTTDTISPTVSITLPLSGAIISGITSPVWADAGDNIAVTKEVQICKR